MIGSQINNPSLGTITWPIFIDQTLRMLVVFISYWLMSFISQEAIAILGVANVLIVFGFQVLECLARSGGIILGQYLGAKKVRSASQVSIILIGLCLTGGGILSCIFYFLSKYFLLFFALHDQALLEGGVYLSIVGGGFIVYGFNYSVIYILNANGLTYITMINSIITNISIIFIWSYVIFLIESDYATLFEYLAYSQVIVRSVGGIFLLISAFAKLDIRKIFGYGCWSEIKENICILIKFSISNALSYISFSFFDILFSKIISLISIEAMIIKGVITSIVGMIESPAVSISKGTQILLGWMIGAGDSEKIKKQMKRSLLLALILTMCASLVAYLWSFLYKIFGISNHFLSNVEPSLLILVIILSGCRALVFQIISGLHAAGDVLYPVVLTTIVLWSILPFCYWGVQFDIFNLNMLWVILIVCEITILFFSYDRWKNRKWQKFGLFAN